MPLSVHVNPVVSVMSTDVHSDNSQVPHFNIASQVEEDGTDTAGCMDLTTEEKVVVAEMRRTRRRLENGSSA